MSEDLVCNFRRCRKRLSDTAWVTACSHIFCDEHASAEFNKSNNCPACDAKLDLNQEVQKQNLKLSEQTKAILLCGQKPETFLDIFSRAFKFWIYQTSQNSAYLEFLMKKERDRSKQLEIYFEQFLSRSKAEISSLKSQREDLRKEVNEATRKMHLLQEQLNERSRQLNKVQGLYDEIRRKHLTLYSSSEELRSPRNILNQSRSSCNSPRVLLSSDFGLQQRPNAKNHQTSHVTSDVMGESGDFILRPSATNSESEFEFRPVTTPMVGSSTRLKTDVLSFTPTKQSFLEKKNPFKMF